MEKEYYQGASGVPPPINPEAPSSFPSSLLWTPYMNPDQDHLFYSNRDSWEKSTDQFNHFDSALTSLVSSSPPGASNLGFSGDIVELIGKLGNICSDSGEGSPQLAVPGSFIYGTNDKNSTKPNLLTNLRNPIPQNPSPMVAEFSGDPGFAQRAAKFSRFGTRSFNGQTGLLGLNSYQSTCGANPLLPRVASTTSLDNNRNPLLRDGKVRKFSESSPSHAEFGNNSQEDSSFSGQIPSGNSRKRKAGTRSKAKDITPSSPSTKAPKVVTESEENANAKRSRLGVGNESVSIKGEEDTKAGSPKPPEPSKDYIHVRARRGQATDSHSLAERVRREKISERMKLLQDLVPGCNKVTGKALMLDEIINYVQSLQRQVEFLSMKLSRVDLSPDFGKIESALRKDMFRTSSALAHPLYSHSLHPCDQQPHQSPPLQADPNSGNSGSQCSVDPMGKALSGFIDEALPQLPAACQDDLQSIVQMGYIHNPNHGSIQ